MKTMKIEKSNQYGHVETFEGSKKKCLEYLRIEAATARRGSRKAHRLPDSVHAIRDDRHPSSLVTMASFRLNGMHFDNLIGLLNSHGVVKYQIK